jgi:hypothetical protein
LVFHVQGAAEKAHRRDGFEPSDLDPSTHQPLDLTGLARELNPHTAEQRREVPKQAWLSGYRRSGYRRSRGREVRTIDSKAEIDVTSSYQKSGIGTSGVPNMRAQRNCGNRSPKGAKG